MLRIRRRVRTGHEGPGPDGTAAPGAVDGAPGPACHAPSRVLYVFPDGDVRSCCASSYSLGNVGAAPLRAIWEGARRAELEGRIAAGDFSLGCRPCGTELQREPSPTAYPRQFDPMAEPAVGGGPTMLGLYLSNACNLQCIQCNGEWSSAIRHHRDHLPPLRTRYDDRFFADVESFVPGLRRLVLAGGEPFLAPELPRVLDLVRRHRPDLDCRIITNGTRWTDEVRAMLEGVRASLIVSVDGATAATFESIRLGARFDEVMANLDAMVAWTHARGTEVTVNHCLMTANVDEFAELLTWADGRDLHVDVSVVREPVELSLASLAAEDLRAVHRRMLADDERVGAQLGRNRATWATELARIGAWADAAERDGGPRSTGWSSGRILMFQRTGAGPTDHSALLRELGERVDGGIVCTMVLEPDDERGVDVVRTIEGDEDIGLTDAVGLLGEPAQQVWEHLVGSYGRARAMHHDEVGPDSAWLRIEFADRTLTALLLADRDHAGTAVAGRILLGALRSPTGPPDRPAAG